MLINVRSDADFQKFLDRREQELHVAMVPVIAQGIRMTIRRGSFNAEAQLVRRGEAVLAAHLRRVYREVYGSVDRARFAKADTRDVTQFMQAQLAAIRGRAARSITRIAHTLTDDIRDKVFEGVEEGWSNDRIAREMADDVLGMARERAAVIARTETHGAAMRAMDEVIDFKEIAVATKQWWTAGDSRVRESHVAMHGVEVARDEPFETDDGDMMFPGDDELGADADGIINCRCVCLYSTAEEEEA